MGQQILSRTFSTNGALSASSCGANALAQPTFDFGLSAAGLRLINTCGPRMFYSLAGDVATTADAYLSSGAVLSIDGQGFRSCGLGLTTTSTSTGTDGQPLYSVMAWASA